MRTANRCCIKSHPKGHWQTAVSRLRYGAALGGQKRFAEAEKHMLQAEKELRTAKDMPPMRYVEAVKRLVALYESWGKAGEAERWRAKLPKESS